MMLSVYHAACRAGMVVWSNEEQAARMFEIIPCAFSGIGKYIMIW
jgi:hypothetical protein